MAATQTADAETPATTPTSAAPLHDDDSGDTDRASKHKGLPVKRVGFLVLVCAAMKYVAVGATGHSIAMSLFGK